MYDPRDDSLDSILPWAAPSTSITPHRSKGGLLSSELATLDARRTARQRVHALRRRRVRLWREPQVDVESGSGPSLLALEGMDDAPESDAPSYADVVGATSLRSDNFWRRQRYGVSRDASERAADKAAQSGRALPGPCAVLPGDPWYLQRRSAQRPGRALPGRDTGSDTPPLPALRKREEAALSPAPLDINLGAEAHLDTYTHHFDAQRRHLDWKHPTVAAYNSQAAELHRLQKWRLAGCPGGAELARRAQTAGLEEMRQLAPYLEAACFEAPKEAALLAAVRLGLAARRPELDAGPAATLGKAALALLGSVASRAGDAHGPAFLIEALEAVPSVGIEAVVYADLILTALFAHTASGKEPLEPTLASRAAAALTWLGSVSGHAGSAPLALMPASRRAIAAVARAIRADDNEVDGLRAARGSTLAALEALSRAPLVVVGAGAGERLGSE